MATDSNGNPRKTKSDQHVSEKPKAIVLMALEKYVGKVCPTNEELSKETGIKKETVSNAISALTMSKKIRRLGSRAGRIIIFTSTGHATLPGLTGIRKEREEGIRVDVMPALKKEKARALYHDVSTQLMCVYEGERVWRQP